MEKNSNIKINKKNLPKGLASNCELKNGEFFNRKRIINEFFINGPRNDERYSLLSSQ